METPHFSVERTSFSHEVKLRFSSEQIDIVGAYVSNKYEGVNEVKKISEVDCREGPAPTNYYLVVRRKP